MKTTEERLSALEGQARTYRRLSLLLILSLSVGLVGAMAQDKKEKVIECDVLKAQKIESQSIELNSKTSGRTRIFPGRVHIESADKANYAHMTHTSAAWHYIKSARSLFLSSLGLKLLMRSKEVVDIGYSEDGAGLIEVTDRLGKASVRLDTWSGDGEIRVRNQSGKIIALIKGDDDSNGQVWVFDEAGKKGKVLKPGK